MDLFSVLVLSIVEGLTEFLPVSSTAHLLLLSSHLTITKPDFLKHFIVFIQFGAISGVIALYWKRFFLQKQVLRLILLSFFPTAALGFLFYPLITNVFFEIPEISLIGLVSGGIVLILFDRIWIRSPIHTYPLPQMNPVHAVLIGVFQSLAVVPGISRSAATIVGAMLLGLEKKSAVEYSFLLAVPTIAAASAYDLFIGFRTFSSEDIYILLMGFTASFLFSIAAMKAFLRYLSNGIFLYFGIYRIAFACIMFVLNKW